MGCCIQNQRKIVINSSNISLLSQESFQNERKNSFEKQPNIATNIVIPKQRKTSVITSGVLIEKEKNKKKETTEKKYMKTMNILKEISYKEVCQSTKYF